MVTTKSPSASPNRSPNRSASKPNSSLSEYLHNQFETFSVHNSIQTPKQKIAVAQRLNNFLQNPHNAQAEGTPNKDGDGSDHNDMFSPIISDVHLTMRNGNRKSAGVGGQDDDSMPRNIANTTSCIQLPALNWQQHFRKGYSMLMWVRFHSPNIASSSSTSETNNTDADANSDAKVKESQESIMMSEPQVLFRFATDDTSMALGIQATLYRNTSKPLDGKTIPSILRVETLRPPAPSNKLDSAIYNSSVTTPILIPEGKWTLIGIQHSHPYLKPPIMNIAMNGEEIFRDELSYPTLGNDPGILMRDNLLLSNIPSADPIGDNMKAKKNASSYESSRLNIDKIDFHGFGLFNDNIPVVIQSIVFEHGPCYSADGVIPSAPPNVQNRDAVVVSGERNGMQKKRGRGMTGPFGHRGGEVPVGRGVGIPLCTGVMLTSDGKYQGEILLQKLLSKLVIGLNASKAVMTGGRRVVMPVAAGCSIGLLGESNVIGLVQPKEPYENAGPSTPKKGKKRGAVEHHEEVLNIAKLGGDVTFFNATKEYLKTEVEKGSLIHTVIPVYNLPSSLVVEKNPIPSFLNTYTSMDAIGYILQTFRLALPPPGYSHNLQMEFYHDSFDHLYDLVVYRDGLFAAQLIDLFAATLSMGGRVREGILHSGSIHVLATLLRRVLLRASRLGMHSSTGKGAHKSEEKLWKVYSFREDPGDELLDIHATKQSAPDHIPKLITTACCSIIAACCGPLQEAGSRWKRSPLPLHIRRASDIALTAVFGFAFEMDIWGNDLHSCAAILCEIVDRYCTDGLDNVASAEITEKFDSTHGRILRGETSIQSLLDTIRNRFGEQIILLSDADTLVQNARRSLATSLSRLLYSMLKYSLSSSRSTSQGQDDVRAAIGALTDCQLGSIGSHAILVALRDILIYCETFPSIATSNDQSHVPAGYSIDNDISSILFNHTSRQSKHTSNDHCLKLKKVKTGIEDRLAKYLILAQFHDVVAPLILSRTIFDGRREVVNVEKSLSQDSSDSTKIVEKIEDLYVVPFHWQEHWRLVLYLFTWLAAVSGSEGTKAAKVTGDLLLHSGKAGSLHRCLLMKDSSDVLKFFVPPFPTATSALSPGSSASRNPVENHINDLLLRLNSFIHLSGGLIAGLLSQDHLPVDRESMRTVISLVSGIKVVIINIIKNNHILTRHRKTENRRSRRIGFSGDLTDKSDIEVPLQLVPSITTAIVLIEETVERIRRTKCLSDSDSWDLVEDGSNGLDPVLDKQRSMLQNCQEILSSLVGHLVSKIMVLGGGEASTIVWRAIISSIDTTLSKSENGENLNSTDPTDTDTENSIQTKSGSSLSLRNNLLCRMASIVLNNIIKCRPSKVSNPWTTVELCSATARLCDLVEEKQLLQLSPTNVNSSCNQKFTLDQVRLLCALLDIMRTGRENTGWCQLILPNPPSQQSNDIEKSKSGEGDKTSILGNYHSLLDAFEEEKQDDLSKVFVDTQLLSQKDEIYDVTSNTILHLNELDIGIKSAQNIYPESVTSSKMLLPILQPTLRVILDCLGFIRGVAVVVNQNNGEDSTKQSNSLMSVMVDELRDTITAAIVGLAFSNARDVCLNTLSALHKGIQRKDKEKDEVVALQYHILFMKAINEMRIRYDGERNKRKAAKQAYGGDETDATNSNQVEMLLMGNLLTSPQSDSASPDEQETLIDQHDNEDFITFSHDNTLESDMKSFSSPRGSATLGWNNYKGFGKALEKCSADDADRNNVEKSKAAFSLLASYLQAWDERQINDDTELIELFDTKVSLEDRYHTNSTDAILGYNTAADSMTSFIELSSAETNRKTELQTTFLPTKRYNCLTFTENLCWKIIMERTYSENFVNSFFERCMADGSRDYGSRLISVPIHPQFPRLIPKQLDHSNIAESSHEIKDDKDIDFDQLNSLVQQGTLKVVDITKKENKNDLAIETDSMDGSQVIVSKPSLESESLLEDFVESEELFLGFPDRDEEQNSSVMSDGLIETFKPVEDKIQEKETITIDIPPMNEQGTLPGDDDNLHDFSISTFSNPPNASSASLQGRNHSQYAHIPSTPTNAAARTTDLNYDNCLHIKPEGNRKGTIYFTTTTLVFEYDDTTGLYEGEELAIAELEKKLELDQEQHDVEANEINYKRTIQHFKKTASQRPKSMRWNITQLSHVYLRRYRLRDSALEMFFIPSGGDAAGGPGLSSALSSILLDFGSGNEGNRRRDEAANAIMSRSPESTVKQWPDKSAQFLHEHLRNITIGWVKGRVSNFDYLLALNCLSGRSFNDLCQYPVFPWVLSEYKSEEIPDLRDKKNFRDLTKPMGALNPERLKEFIERFQTFDDPMIPSFMYGSHYSTSAGVVLHFLVRLHPFASLHRQLQGGHFDVADRLFSSVSRSWDMCTGQSAAEVKELTPEWYCNPSFLRNTNKFKLGASQDGDVIGDVELPPWAKGSPEKFVEVLRCALESDICTSMLPDWIDLIFGRKQQGQEAVEANNVFFYLTYYGSCDVASIEDEDLRIATELQIAHFGQCPMQLFWRPHVQKLTRSSARRRLSLSEMLGVFELGKFSSSSPLNRQLPFESAPISHWVHLFAPPPGPHAPLISVRFIFPDRCLAIDAQGIFHFFRWAWRTETDQDEDRRPFKENDLFSDRGHFVGQRELPHFRSVPRLPLSQPKPSNWKNRTNFAVLAISKCLFAGRSLLVVSDGDRKGGICLQMVDPSKCVVQGEVFIKSAHSSRISAVHMDSIGVAAGVGGVGGELTLVGSQDGTASLWRFISNPSCHLPIRPRFRFGGHRGQKIHSVAVNSSINLCATVSASRCCIFNASSGCLQRIFVPPNNDMSGMTGTGQSDIICETRFVDANAICITSSGFVILACESKFWSKTNSFNRVIVTLQLFTSEGAHMGSKALESWRGIPNKITATYDGRAVMVCSGRGISIHLISAIKPLHFIDEWQIGGDEDDVVSAHDIDFGPSPSRPVVAVTGLSSGALRIHALKGISEWSDENKKGSVTEAVGSVIGTVKGTGSKMVGLVRGTGSKVIGLGKEIGREAVEGRGVTGFLGDVFGKKMNP